MALRAFCPIRIISMSSFVNREITGPEKTAIVSPNTAQNRVDHTTDILIAS